MGDDGAGSVIAGGKGRLRLHPDGILYLSWTPGSSLGAGDAAESVAAVQRISRGRRLPLLVEMTAVALDAPARSTFGPAEALAAVALVGSDNVDRVVAAALCRFHSCPSGYFISREAARAWLQGFSVQIPA